jgi:hypothetical protein
LDTFGDCSISFKFKEGVPASAGLTTPINFSPGWVSIHGVFRGLKLEPDPDIEQKRAFCKSSLESLPPT